MKRKTAIEQRIRGWLPKEKPSPSSQTIGMLSHLTSFYFMRLAYGVVLGSLLVVPFGVYHSVSEPYVTGYLWGYDLPIGYAGLLLGVLTIFYPRINRLRSLRFSSLIPIIGISLLLTLVFSPNYYFVNLLHGTSFSSFQIDVDFQLGNSAVVGLSFLSMVLGLASATLSRIWKVSKQPQ
jgi:hypothetical protein